MGSAASCSLSSKRIRYGLLDGRTQCHIFLAGCMDPSTTRCKQP